MITGGGTGSAWARPSVWRRPARGVVLVGRREAELAAAAKRIGPAASFVPHDITRLDRAAELAAAAERAAAGRCRSWSTTPAST